jgi:hypothetical protein
MLKRRGMTRTLTKTLYTFKYSSFIHILTDRVDAGSERDLLFFMPPIQESALIVVWFLIDEFLGVGGTASC